jgi:lethal(2) giant larvae protein
LYIPCFIACILANGEESPKEPSLKPAASTTDINGEDDRQDLSSVGDITIDSVKDHLL